MDITQDNCAVQIVVREKHGIRIWGEFHLIAAIFAVFVGSLRGTATLAVALSMRPQSLFPCHFVFCVVVSP